METLKLTEAYYAARNARAAYIFNKRYGLRVVTPTAEELATAKNLKEY